MDIDQPEIDPTASPDTIARPDPPASPDTIARPDPPSSPETPAPDQRAPRYCHSLDDTIPDPDREQLGPHEVTYELI